MAAPRAGGEEQATEARAWHLSQAGRGHHPFSKSWGTQHLSRGWGLGVLTELSLPWGQAPTARSLLSSHRPTDSTAAHVRAHTGTVTHTHVSNTGRGVAGSVRLRAMRILRTTGLDA